MLPFAGLVFGLEPKDWMTALLPLLGVAVAVWKEVASPDKKFGRMQMAAVTLGLAGFGSSLYQAAEARTKGAVAQAEADRLNERTEAIKKETEDIRRRTVEAAGLAQATLEQTKGLEGQLSSAALELKAVVKGSTDGLSEAVRKSGDATGDSVKAAGVAIGGEIRRVNDAVAVANGKLAGEIDRVNQAVAGSQAATTQAVAAVGQVSGAAMQQFGAQTVEATREVQRSMQQSLNRLPVEVPQNGEASLLGNLEGFRVKAYEIRGWNDNRPTQVELRNTRTGQVERVEFNFKQREPKNRFDGEVPFLPLEHEGQRYRLEVAPRTPTNWFGKAEDSLLCRVVLVQ